MADGYLNDPMSVGVGARALGMGKAYVAMAEDGDAIFINPAGLARITNPKLTTMYSSLMGDVSYMVIGGAFPLGEKSAIGAGFVGSSVGDIPLTNSTGGSLGTGRWSNNVMFLSYGTYLSNYGINLGRDVLLGGSVKYFSVGGDGAGVSNASGSGYDIDLGVLAPVTDYMTIGANYQNALPASMGGKITKSTGTVDTIPATLKMGTKINLIGKEGEALSPHGTRKLYANLDYDLSTDISKTGALHAGVEFWPTNNLAIRAGSDAGNLTAGVGVRFSGIEFNYAYHPYHGINENTSHFFSISYLGEGNRQLKVTMQAPNDKSIVYDDNAKIKGKVEVIGEDGPAPTGPISVKVNGIQAVMGPNNTFTAEIPLKDYGKNLVVAEAADNAGNTGKLEARLVRLVSFSDVPDGYWAKMPIENNATVGLVQGFPDKTFRPARALTRAELATLLVRAKGVKIPEGNAEKIFKDVKATHWAAKYIQVAVREGLVEGYPDKSFRPNNKINRVEGLVVMVRFDQLRLTQVEAKPYWDITTKHWAAKYVQAAKEAGMLSFVEKNTLNPRQALARSESVEMLGKTSLAGGRIKDLYTWEKGFQQPEKMNAPQGTSKVNADLGQSMVLNY